MMTGKNLKELPYYERPDLTPYLIHLTKESVKNTGLKNLISILKDGVIEGTNSFIKRASRESGVKAACFMDVPFAALKYVCSPKNAGRYQAYGVVVRKQDVYQQMGRPVLHLSGKECEKLNIPPKQLWRVVSLEYDGKANIWIDWQHEREWRCPNEFDLKKVPCIALVESVKDVKKLQDKIDQEPALFQCVPITIIPLEVICQGFGS
jgi:hypothetical protein